jgi:hypothetical protein
LRDGFCRICCKNFIGLHLLLASLLVVGIYSLSVVDII